MEENLAEQPELEPHNTPYPKASMFCLKEAILAFLRESRMKASRQPHLKQSIHIAQLLRNPSES
jgi:hypothetical protein